MDAFKHAVRLRIIAGAVCWALCIADYNGLLVYHPSGRGETPFERVAHGLLIGGGCLIGSFFFAVALSIIAKIVRTQDRISRGLCCTCGYDLRASPQCCPECGSTAPAEHAA